MPGSRAEAATGGTVAQEPAANKLLSFISTNRVIVRLVPIARLAAASVLGLRVAYGVALIAAPKRLALRWLGPAAADAPLQVALRALGAREAILHAGALVALGREAPVRPWLAASAAGDVTDIIATAAGRRRLPRGSTPATLAVGGGSALISLALARALEK